MEILNGTAGRILYIEVASGARDGGPDGGNNSKKLMPGMVLGKITSGNGTGSYSNYDNTLSNGREDETLTVVLREIIEDISTGNQLVHASVGGTCKREQLRFHKYSSQNSF